METLPRTSMSDHERERYETTIRTLSTAKTLERVLLVLIFLVSIGLSLVVFWQNQNFQTDSARRSAERAEQIKQLQDNTDKLDANNRELKAYIKCISISASNGSLGDVPALDACARDLNP